MIVAVHQPEYLPWPGFFSKMKLVDRFVFLDNVQFEKNNVQNRNILENRNIPIWYTLPIHKFKSNSLISQIKINRSERIFETQLRNFQHNYSNDSQVFSAMYKILENSALSLVNNNLELIEVARTALGITTETSLASSIHPLTADPTNRIIEIVKSVGGNAYLAGPSASKYLNERAFELNGIKVYNFNYKIPTEIHISGNYQYSMFHWILKNHANLHSILIGKIAL
jgi:hypothetical protein